MSNTQTITDPTTWAQNREIVLDEQAHERTVLTLPQVHPTVEQRDATIGFGTVEFGRQTMQKLAHHLGVA